MFWTQQTQQAFILWTKQHLQKIPCLAKYGLVHATSMHLVFGKTGVEIGQPHVTKNAPIGLLRLHMYIILLQNQNPIGAWKKFEPSLDLNGVKSPKGTISASPGNDDNSVNFCSSSSRVKLGRENVGTEPMVLCTEKKFPVITDS